MKKISLSLVAMVSISLTSALSANTLSDALSNGKISGDLSATYEVRDLKKDLREPLIINYQEHFSNLSRNFS